MKRKVLLFFLCCGIMIGEEVYSRLRVYHRGYSEILPILQMDGCEPLQIRDNYVDMLVKSSALDKFDRLGLRYEIIIKDLAQYYLEMLGDGKGGVFGNYYLYREVYQEILNLQSRFPGLVKVDSLPIRSIENRALYLVKVSNSPNSNNGKPEVLISGAMHAYEPIGPSVCMSDMTYLCEHYATDPEIRWLVDNRQVYFIPVMNPDGYVYNETYPSRMWRKNRRLNQNGSYGVDLNRNYPYKWGYDNIGSSPNPSAWNYRGTAPASEPETQAVIDFVNRHRIRTWHNHHSPNDVLLIPFGYIDSYPWGDTLVYNTICREESLLYGFQKWGNSYRAYGYLVNGGMEDWAWSDSATYRIYGLVPELGMDYWEGLNDSSKIVNVCMRMLNAELYLIQIAGFFPLIFSIAVHDSPPGGNNDGVINPGERARLRITIKNKAVVDTALGLTGYISTSYQHLRVTDSTGSYGDVLRLSRAVNSADPFAVACSSSARPNDWVHFNLRLVWNSNNYQKILPCSLRIGPVTGVAEKAEMMLNSEGKVLEISPNPFQSRVDFRWNITGTQSWSHDETFHLKIYDAAGRSVRAFPIFSSGSAPSGWDGTDDRGRRLPAGVYICRIKGDRYLTIEKIIKLAR